MTTVERQVREKIREESSLPPRDRTQPVPCAFCARGGNGDRTCSGGWEERKYSKYKGCFAGTLIEEETAHG